MRILAEDLAIGRIVVGQGFRFGFRAAGTTETLLELGHRYNVEVGCVRCHGG